MPMACFLDLPPELVLVILSHIPEPHVLATACLVSHTFCALATPVLYESIAVFPWHRQGKVKVIQLFATLSRYKHLAKYVQTLEIREFPKAFTRFSTTAINVSNTVTAGLANCVHLRSCTWTRDGSLNSAILQTIQKCTMLQELEINGHSEGNYDPDILLQFTTLRKLSLIMPSAPMIDSLSSWTRTSGTSLRGLTLICKVSSVVTDSVLSSLAPHLVNIDHLHIAGCPKVTHEGIWALLSPNPTGISRLRLEGLSPNFDMTEFARRCSQSATFSHLRSVTLTVNQKTPLRTWTEDVSRLLMASPLEIFQIYSTGAFFEASTTNDFCSWIVTRHCSRLTVFSVHRMLVSLDTIANICCQCVALEELFVTMEREDLNRLGPCLSPAQMLHTVHINYPEDVHVDDHPAFSPADALALVRQGSSSITQFGCNTRVWQVKKTFNRQQDGQISTETYLTPYKTLSVPEQYLVVRV